jgi:DNA-binding NarL/FixJ family response regulator
MPYGLTACERGVILALLDGETYKQQALRRDRSTATVRTHIHNAYRKMGVANSHQALAKWVREQELPGLTRQAYEAGYRAGLRDASRLEAVA